MKKRAILHTVIIFMILLVCLLPLLSACSPADPITDDLYISGDIYQWDGGAWVLLVPGAAVGDVTAAANLTTDMIVRGDGGLKGVKTSTVSIDNFGNLNTGGGDITGFDINAGGTIDATGDINTDSDVNSGNDVNITNDLDVTDDADIGGFLDVVDGLEVGAAANYSTFSADGTLTMAGTARVINAQWIDAGAIKAPGAKPATAIAHGTLETPAWQFANQAVAGNQETVSFSMKISQEMDRSVEPTITLGWSSTTNAGNVKWQLEYLWRTEDESTIAAAQETLTVTTAVSAVAEGLIESTFTGIDIPSGTDVCIHCRVTRLSADIADTVADTVELHGLCMSWTSDKLGS